MDHLRPELFKRLSLYRNEADNLRGLEEFRKVMIQDVNISDPLVKQYINDIETEQGEEKFCFSGIKFRKICNQIWTWFLSSGSKMVSKISIFTIIRYPLLLIIGIIVVLVLIIYFIVRLIVASLEYLNFWTGKAYNLQKKLKKSKNYQEWKASALKLDEFLSLEKWKKQSMFDSYDCDLLINLTKNLNQYRLSKSFKKVKELLVKAGSKANFGNIENIRLYSNTHYGTKLVVDQYLNEVKKSLDFIANSSQISNYDKYKFFKLASKNYGKTALCLSGGATIAYYHYGVVKALLEEDMLPRIISGSSIGSVIASLAACHTDEELKEIINPDMCALIKPCRDPLWKKLEKLVQTGACFDHVDIALQLQWVTRGNTTFLEAYQRTGKILNITTTLFNSCSSSKVLNYLSAPNCVIWSAILASSAIPGVTKPITLMTKKMDGSLTPFYDAGLKWRDGSFKSDIPTKALSNTFNVKYTIVSQVNPHISLFFYNRRGNEGNPVIQNNGQGWRGGFILASIEHILRQELKKWLSVLKELELIPKLFKIDWPEIWLQKFDGNLTILQNFCIWDYWYILTDPSYNRLNYQINSGKKSVWPKLKAIYNRNLIEKTIYNWLEEFKN